MALTAKQRRFVEEYLIDLNATQAAERAGYSAKTAYSIGNENLSKPEIAKAIQAAMKKREDRTQITQDRVLRELAKIGFADIRKIVRWGNTTMVPTVNDAGQEAMEACHGLALIGADEIDDDTAAAIAEISEGRDGLKVKLHDKKGALVDIGRHLGMFKDKVEHSGTINTTPPFCPATEKPRPTSPSQAAPTAAAGIVPSASSTGYSALGNVTIVGKRTKRTSSEPDSG